MTPEEYEIIKTERPIEPHIYIYDLNNKQDRTLLWGYHLNRRSHHVYFLDGQLHLYIYGGWDDDKPRHQWGMCLSLKDVVPTKRLYPEACDYEMCLLLKRRGVGLPFTTWNPDRESAQFYGELAPKPYIRASDG